MGVAGAVSRQRRARPLGAIAVRVASFAATAAIARRLGLPLRSALMAALLFAAIRRSYPVLAYTAGNDHSASFFTWRRSTACWRSPAAPAAGLAVYAGVALGLLLGTKYIGLLFAPAILAVLALAGLGRRWALGPGRAVGVAAAGRIRRADGRGRRRGRRLHLPAQLGDGGESLLPCAVELPGPLDLPRLGGGSLESRLQSPEARIAVWRFLLDRRDLLGSFFPYTMLPGGSRGTARGARATARRLVAGPSRVAPSAVFFLEFLYLMADHRDNALLPARRGAGGGGLRLAGGAGRTARRMASPPRGAGAGLSHRPQARPRRPRWRRQLPWRSSFWAGSPWARRHGWRR